MTPAEQADITKFNNSMPGHHLAAIVDWLQTNQKQPEQVRYGSYPLGMVQRYMERAEGAEAGEPSPSHVTAKTFPIIADEMGNPPTKK